MKEAYAHFVKNTIDPMLDKISDILFMADQKGLPIDKESASDFLERLFLAHVCTLIIKGIIYLGITAIVCFTIFKVL